MYYLNSDGSPDVEEFSECQCLTCMKKRKINYRHPSLFSWRNIIILILLILGIYFATTINVVNTSGSTTLTSTSESPTMVSDSANTFEMPLL